MTDFEQFFRDNRDFVFKYLMSLTRDESLAAELTQETFFRAYINYGSLRNQDSGGAWLCRIAKNCFYAWFNEQKRREPLEDAEQLAGPDSPEELLLRKELSRKALGCLHALEEPYKEVMMLSVFGGVSLKDISRLFGKSESWARVTYYRARQKLSERMREQDEL